MTQAVEHHQRALEITRQMDDKRGEGYTLADLGDDYLTLGEHKRAVQHLQEARAIFVALGMQNRLSDLDRKLEQARKTKKG